MVGLKIPPVVLRRLPLILSVVVGLAVVVLAAFLTSRAVNGQPGGFTDLVGRVNNIKNLQHTGNIYLPFGVEAFTYPPGAIFLFYPLVWLPANHLSSLWTLLCMLALAGAYVLASARLTRWSLPRSIIVGSVVAGASPLIFPEVYAGFFWGQVGTFLLLAVVLDELAVRGRFQGVLVGIVTAIKIYPGVFIVMWFLRRQWRQAITATVTTLSLTVAAIFVWPASAREFFSTLVFGGQELAHFTSLSTARESSSIATIFSRPPIPLNLVSQKPVLLITAALVVVALIGAYRLDRRGYVFSSMIVLITISVFGAPIAWDHYFVFLPLLALVPFELGWRSPLSIASLIGFALGLFPWHHFRVVPPGSWLRTDWAYVSQSVYLAIGLSLIATSFWVGPREGVDQSLDARSEIHS